MSNTDVNSTSVIPTNLTSSDPTTFYNLEDSHVIPGLLHRSSLAKRKGIPRWRRDQACVLRQCIFSHDLAKLFIGALRVYHDIDPIILSGSYLLSMQTAKYAKYTTEATLGGGS
ncbi:hypothetical protein PhCBS80983_g04759 [Powellomyces hirtus]|uniref:Uncharacterized protein n=1 Tax=Powellomyces hirtus TaxID=109895 RepID=A0A507DZ90_9FUNG|nr:hypothetical protein PhCBS80983_g04759 [Powellomyces hirtus]